MAKTHFKDLSEINTPFGLLDNDTQKRLREHKDKVEIYSGTRGWKVTPIPCFHYVHTYRAKREPLFIPWEDLRPEVNFAAMDKDGNWRGFQEKPFFNFSHGFWSDGNGFWSLEVLGLPTYVSPEESLQRKPYKEGG